MMRAPLSTYLDKRHCTPHSAGNIIRYNDIDLMDLVFSDTSAVTTGETVAQIISAGRSKFVSIHSMKSVSKDDWELFRIMYVDMMRLGSDGAAVYNGNHFTSYIVVTCISAFNKSYKLQKW